MIEADPCGAIIFLDKAGSNMAIAPIYGWAASGEQAIDATPHENWNRLTVIRALRLHGSMGAMTVEGACHTDSFLAYLERAPMPFITS